MFIHIFVVVEHMINEDVKYNSMEHGYNFMAFLIIIDDVLLDLLNVFMDLDLKLDFVNVVVDVKLLFELLVGLE